MPSESRQRTGPADPLRQIAQCHEKIAGHLARLDAMAASETEAVGDMRHAVDRDRALVRDATACAIASTRTSRCSRACVRSRPTGPTLADACGS